LTKLTHTPHRPLFAQEDETTNELELWTALPWAEGSISNDVTAMGHKKLGDMSANLIQFENLDNNSVLGMEADAPR